jgi:hypothetical protein
MNPNNMAELNTWIKYVEHSIVDTCIAIDPIGVNIKVNYEIVPNEDVHRAHCIFMLILSFVFVHIKSKECST